MRTRVNGARKERVWIPDESRLGSQTVVRLSGLQTGEAIVCTSGVLWVTQEGDPEDYLLQKGSAFVANRRGVVVIQALTPAAYRLSSCDKLYEWMFLNLKGERPP